MCFKGGVEFGSSESTTQTSLHSVLGIVAAIPTQVTCYDSSAHSFLMLSHLREADMSNFTPLFHQIPS